MTKTWFLGVPELRRALGAVIVLALGAFLLLPLLTMLLWAFTDVWRYPQIVPSSYSLRWWKWVFQNGNMTKAIFWSVTTAPVVTLLSGLICLPAAYSFSRLNFPGRRFLFISLLAANAFPKFGLYIFIATLFFQVGLINTFWGVVFIQMINTLVVMTWIPAAGFDSVPRELEEAARDAGAGPLRTFWRVTLPIAMPALIVAAILAFLAAFDEAQGTLIVGAPRITTMPVLMYTLVTNYPEPASAVFSILLAVPSLILLVIARRFLLAGYLAAGFKGR
ncbi:MAG TPA: carbohydrate ABC transporter permease [Thermomicrobiales bacterium]|nr:carbohydrate ABC transporter permease [Thermomicrobiales bacterium]